MSKNGQLRGLDLFAGIGGSSLGARQAGVAIVGAIDRWALAAEVYADNFKHANHLCSSCEELDPKEVARKIGKVDILIASPECTSHTCAKGSAPRSEQSRETAFQVTRFAECFRPRWVVIENVVHMRSWQRYDELIEKLRSLDYNVREQVLNAADFGVPQSRRRLFLLCDSKRVPNDVTPRSCGRHATVRDILADGTDFRFSRLHSKGRAVATLRRAARAIRQIGQSAPFLIVYYGSDAAGGWQRIDRPLRTITTLDRFAYVRTSSMGHEMRMLQVPELKAAMGFPSSYKLRNGTRRDQIKMLGNAVCPPVMKAVIRTLVKP